MKKSRVLYLDVDDTLIVWDRNVACGKFAPHAVSFLKWASEHFEIRWLTFWCSDGIMSETRAMMLEELSGYKLPHTFFSNIKNDRAFYMNKCDGIDFTDPRPYVWVEDQIPTFEYAKLKGNGGRSNYYPCHVTNNPQALLNTAIRLAERFKIPMFDIDEKTDPYLDSPYLKELTLYHRR